MKVIVNAVGYVGQAAGAGGAGVFLQHLVARLATVAEVDVLVAPNARTFPEGPRPGRFIELPFLSADILRQLRAGPTVVLDPFGSLPCAPFPEDMALCAVVHDLMHLERPHFFTAAERAIRTHCFREGLQRADAVIAFSEDQARAIRRLFPGTRPEVIPHLPYMALAAPDAAPPPDLPGDLGRFVLFPAVRWPHKNHKTLVEAFGAHVRQTGSDLRLVMTGGPCAESRFSYLPQPEAISDQVLDLGRVSDATLRALFERAEAVLFPTQYEGFGIPVLEAAQLGKMVVATRLPVFDEILGAANYRAVEDTLCHLRWMEALAAIEDGAIRAGFEAASARARAARGQTPERFLAAFEAVLRNAAERYAGPARYPNPHTRHGDRITARIVAGGLRFADIHGTATAERGTAHPVLGADPAPQAAFIFRSAPGAIAPNGTERAAAADGTARRSCLRADYALPPEPARPGARTIFSAWLRLHGESGLEALHLSVADGAPVDLLPELRQGQWHLCRIAVPRRGPLDLRGVRGGATEAPGYEIEIHDPCLLEIAPMPDPAEAPLAAPGLTVVIAGLEPEVTSPGGIAAQVAALEATLPPGAAPRWIAVVPGVNPAALPAAGIPAALRFLTVGPAPFAREDADALLTPYEPIGAVLLLEAEDLEACRDDPACRAGFLAAVTGAATGAAAAALPLPPNPGGFWRAAERGRVIGAAHRIGQPVPLLDPAVIDACLARAGRRRRPRFAVIETDRTSEISHHGTVTGLFLRGAEALGWQPVLGLHGDPAAPVARSAGRSAEGIETWEGFSTQVYAPGSAEDFAAELARFVAATGLGPEDLIFLHSLAPQILLGAARFLAATPEAEAPRIAMRFFSTAEAMRGHRLSYVKILRSILAVRAVRTRMRFFCESRNLVAYYEEQVGVRFPLLLNPEHPDLVLARDSAWLDPALGAGQGPVLAYFGEAREEKGFEALPGILAELLAAEALSDHRFLVQTGSNRQNETPRMARAKAALAALRARHPDRLRTFESVETPEQLYFLMKHAQGVLAPYRPESYGRRGTGITLEALQMGLDVYAFAETDLHATFRGTGRLIAAPDEASFARTVIRHRTGAEPAPPSDPEAEEMRLLHLGPAPAVARLLALAAAAPEAAAPPAGTVLWVGNDTFGEGNSAVYAAQKMALASRGHDCLELFVPWPDRNWSGVDPAAFDTKVYGFDSGYDTRGLAWVARPRYTPEQIAVLEEIERHGPTYGRLRDLNRHFALPASLARAIAALGLDRTLLNYAHLLPVIAEAMPIEGVVCETHDIMAYQHAVRRGDGVSLAEKIEEFSDLSKLPRIVSISAAERREIAGACGRSRVEWRLPPFVPEPPPAERTAPAHADWVRALEALGGVPDAVARPTPLMLRSYAARPDLQALFPLNTPTGRAAFFRWWCFFGQQELPGESFGLSLRQVAWLLEGTPEDTTSPAAGLGGVLRMLLAAREDLRRAFLPAAGPEGAPPVLRREAFEGWAAQNLPREHPLLAPPALAARAERFFARAGAAETALLEPGGAALTATLEAAPAFGAQRPAEAEALLARIAATETVDLALVGSGHPSNVESFRWFLDEVWLKAFAPRGRNLFILGHVCEHLRGYQHRLLFPLGRCERIGPVLAAARACPLPVVVGSGSPIKTIPAMAMNGAVTVTEHIERAFALAEHGIPAVSDAREFADDLWSLLLDDAARQRRQAASARYVAAHLRFEDYAAFWGGMLR